MEKKFYPLLLWIFFGILHSAEAQDSAYDKLPPCSTDYKTQQDSGKSPYFVYEEMWSYGSGQDSNVYRFTCFPDELNCSYRWDFGDHSPISSDWFGSHLYTDSGSYPVTLTVIRSLATGTCVSRSTRIVHTVPFIYSDSLKISVTQDPKNPAIYTYTLQDSAL